MQEERERHGEHFDNASLKSDSIELTSKSMELDLSALPLELRNLQDVPSSAVENSANRNQSRQQLDDIVVEIREQQDEESKEVPSASAANEPFQMPSTVPRNVIYAEQPELLQQQNQTEEIDQVDNEIGLRDSLLSDDANERESQIENLTNNEVPAPQNQGPFKDPLYHGLPRWIMEEPPADSSPNQG